MPTKVQVKVKAKDEAVEPKVDQPSDSARVIDLRGSGSSTPTTPTTPRPYESQQRGNSGGGGGGGYRDYDEPHKVVRDVSRGDSYSHGSTASSGGSGSDDDFASGRDVPTQEVSGMLDIAQDGHGFLRPKFRPSDADVYVSSSLIRKFGLRPGDFVKGMGRPPKESERYFGLLKVVEVNEVSVEKQGKRIKFEDLTPIYPNKKLKLEMGKTPLSNRVIDIIAPIGMGQRGMIVSPPKAGKTTILKDIARGISENFPKVHLMAALIGKRPEEVTDISRSVKGEVIASNFDEPAETQTRVAEIALERATS